MVQWRRRGVERTPVIEYALSGPPRSTPERKGWEYGQPVGGTTTASAAVVGGQERREFMEELHQAYLACQWSNVAVDVVSRTCTAGGIQVAWGQETKEALSPEPTAPTEVLKLRNLLDYVNPREDIRQLLRGVYTDLQVFGDAFLEIVYLLGEPVALYSLDSPTMVVRADEHGQILGYAQIVKPGSPVEFEPHQVIHIGLDSPRDGLYGVGPTQKSLLAITSWLFTAGLLKEIMRKGNPPNVHVDFPLAAQDQDMERFRQQYVIRNLGALNVGNPLLSRGLGPKSIAEIGVSRVAELLATLDKRRDEILAGYGVPPSKASVIESGNLGGGTGTSQDKMFRINTCGPLDELVYEKLNFDVAREGFGIRGWHMKPGEVDWRDDKIVEEIRDQRVRNGSWTLNRYRDEIGEPAVEGGDVPVLVDRQMLVVWSDIPAYSTALIADKMAGAQAIGLTDDPATLGALDPDPTAVQKSVPKAQPIRSPKQESAALESSWNAQFQRLRKVANRALREHHQEEADV